MELRSSLAPQNVRSSAPDLTVYNKQNTKHVMKCILHAWEFKIYS